MALNCRFLKPLFLSVLESGWIFSRVYQPSLDEMCTDPLTMCMSLCTERGRILLMNQNQVYSLVNVCVLQFLDYDRTGSRLERTTARGRCL